MEVDWSNRQTRIKLSRQQLWTVVAHQGYYILYCKQFRALINSKDHDRRMFVKQFQVTSDGSCSGGLSFHGQYATFCFELKIGRVV